MSRTEHLRSIERLALHVARGMLSACGASVCAVYGAWSWVHGPRVRLPLSPAEVRRILVIRVDLLGDLVFSLPTIQALADAYPRARVDALVLPYTAPVLSGVRSVGRIHTLDVHRYRRPRGVGELATLVGTIRALRQERYDLAVSLSGTVGGVLALASGARVRVGHIGDSYRGCYNVAVPGRRYDRPVHEVEYGLELVRALGPALRPQRPRITGEWDKAVEATDPPSRFDLCPRPPYAVLVPGASNGSAKRWPARYWSALADRLARERRLGIALVGSAAERELAAEVARGTAAPVHNLAGRTTVQDLMAMLAGATIVVAGDTGPLHLAAALGRPVIGIYGPTDPVNTGPMAEHGSVVRLGLPCSPCYDLRTPAECKLPDRSIACMWGVEPDRVYAAVCELLDSVSPRSASEASPSQERARSGADLHAARESTAHG